MRSRPPEDGYRRTSQGRSPNGMSDVSEPRILIPSREHLWWLLLEAAELEHMIMCQYLFAEFSLKPADEPSLTAEQSDAVQRWRKTISGIAVEEMLHLALVYNLLTAIGGAPHVQPAELPSAVGVLPVAAAAGPHALRRAGAAPLPVPRAAGGTGGLQHADGFVPSAPPRTPVEADEIMPRGQEYTTVGRLYRGIADGLRTSSSCTARRPCSSGCRRRRPPRSGSSGRRSSP